MDAGFDTLVLRLQQQHECRATSLSAWGVPARRLASCRFLAFHDHTFLQTPMESPSLPGAIYTNINNINGMPNLE